jgi:restriction system protein
MSNLNQDWARVELLRSSTLAAVDAMTGTQFEQYFAELLRRRGYRNVTVVGAAGDGGVDILATDPAGAKVAYQCKRQTTSVSVPVIRQLLGSVSHEHRARIPYVVTTATLTKPAADLALRAGVKVIDRSLLANWMTEAQTPSETRPGGRDGWRALGVTRSELYAPGPKSTGIEVWQQTHARSVINGDGIFVVGLDIKPGRYRTAGPMRDRGYWALLSSTDSSDVIDNNFVTGPIAITVERGVKAVEVRGCQPWHLIASDHR